MRHIIDGLILLLGGSLAISIVAKATLVAVVGLLGAWLGRRSRAAVRHAILAASFSALLALPIASILVPAVRIAVPAETEASTVSLLFPGIAGHAQPGASTQRSIIARPVISQWSGLSLSALLLATWLAGAAFFLVRMIVGLRQVQSLRRFGLPWYNGQLVVERLALDTGIHRHIEVLLHESLPAPVTCGSIHPAIMIPPDAQNWDEEDLMRAMIHEIEHVRRCDWMSQHLARIVCAAYWFHPLVWIAWRQLALEAERACDDAVIGRSEATAYADQLVGLARRLSTTQRSPALAMANRSDLSARVGSVLDARQARGRAGAFLIGVTCSGAALVVLTISPLRMVAAPQSTSPSGHALPGFEVASIRLNTSGSDKAYLQATPGRLEITNVALRRLILSAYGGQDYQISGDPPWAGSDHYDIQAKAAGNASVQQMEGPMLQVLLKERFHLKVHRETRQFPVYELTVAKSGSKLEHSKESSCVPYSVDSPPPSPVAPGVPHPVFCGFPKLGIDGLNRTLDGVGVSMEGLAGNLSRSYTSTLGRTVLDKTGLTGIFDLHLKWAVEASVSDSGDTTSIFTALQEQLGLKLESAKGPVEVLVIDHVEQPSEN